MPSPRSGRRPQTADEMWTDNSSTAANPGQPAMRRSEIRPDPPRARPGPACPSGGLVIPRVYGNQTTCLCAPCLGFPKAKTARPLGRLRWPSSAACVLLGSERPADFFRFWGLGDRITAATGAGAARHRERREHGHGRQRPPLPGLVPLAGHEGVGREGAEVGAPQAATPAAEETPVAPTGGCAPPAGGPPLFKCPRLRASAGRPGRADHLGAGGLKRLAATRPRRRGCDCNGL